MAGRIPDSFLAELRARLPVSDVVRRRIPDLKRAGHEWKCLSPFNKERTPSFTVNDDKQLWHDFSSGRGGSIIDFEMLMTGGTFIEAVRDLAELAGLKVPGDSGASAPARRGGTPPQTSAPPPDEPDDPGPMPDAGPAPASTRRQIAATYDYTDADGGVIYQVVRQEWRESGERKKTFIQRRPAWGDDTGRWIWGLAAGPYVQGADGNFWLVTKSRATWPGRRIDVPDDVPHTLYRMAELSEELAQPPGERRVILSPEGEKDCDTLHAWGLVATDSSGGSNKWSPHHAEMLRGCDVVVLMDNDKTGREYGHRKAASLRGIASRVRVLDWAQAWPQAPQGADVTDWRDVAGGTAPKLWALIDALPEWTPAPPESEFGAVRWLDLDKPARELEWLIKEIMQRGETSIWYGQPGSGKTFLITDASMAVARGLSWMGQRVRPGLVIYVAGEGALGLKRRLRAYRRHHRVTAPDLPFVILGTPVNLYAGDGDADKLIAEIKGWASFYDAPLELVVIDTITSVTPGADENAGKDMGPVLARGRRIASETGAHVAWVHHTPKGGGTPRGWSGFTGNVESTIEIVRTEESDEQLEPGADHVIKRDVRRMTVIKQKDGPDGLTRSFVLKQIVLGADVDGDNVTSCIVWPLDIGHAAARTTGGPREIPFGWLDMKPNNRMILRALVKALAGRGRMTPIENVHAPHGTQICTVGDWISALVEMRYANDADDPPVDGYPLGRRLHNSCKKAIERTYGEKEWAGKMNIIGKDREWVWRTSRKVVGVDTPPPSMARPQQPMLLAPGESADEIADVLGGGTKH